jgi:hypothetical protein
MNTMEQFSQWMIGREEIHEKRLQFRRLPDGLNHVRMIRRLIGKKLTDRKNGRQLNGQAVAENPGNGKASAGCAVAERATWRFVPMIMIGGRMRSCSVRRYTFVRMAVCIRTGETRQQQQPKRKKVYDQLHKHKCKA